MNEKSARPAASFDRDAAHLLGATARARAYHDRAYQATTSFRGCHAFLNIFGDYYIIVYFSLAEHYADHR